jgi:hypothetical protein
MTRDGIAALATAGIRAGLLDQHSKSFVQQVPDQRSLRLNGVFDLVHVGAVDANTITNEVRRLYRLDAQLVEADRKIATLRGEMLNGAATGAQFEALSKIDMLEATLLTVPAVSLAGVRAKLRRALAFLESNAIAGILIRDALLVLDVEVGS